jgi:hypothetical protein
LLQRDSHQTSDYGQGPFSGGDSQKKNGSSIENKEFQFANFPNIWDLNSFRNRRFITLAHVKHSRNKYVLK